MAVKINCASSKGGAVQFYGTGKSIGTRPVWASYAVASVGDIEPSELFYAGITLPGGKSIQLFVNRETGLVVVDAVAKNGKSGVELIRKVVT